METQRTIKEDRHAAARAQPIPFRIFLASPGDVQDERELARKVIEYLQGERAFRGRVDLECIAWDQPGVEVAMEATLTPQEAIKRGLPRPAECDLVVVILWSRMGTPLPAEYRKPDGTPYLSGTEWEYLDAVRGARSGERPAVWLYRRTHVPDLNLEDPEFDDKCRQWKKVKSFFEALVGEDGSLTGGINTYRMPDEFRGQFEHHLRDHLTAVLQESSVAERKVALTEGSEVEPSHRWTGPPYPGLEAFKPEQAPIFFGRGAEVDQLLEILRNREIRFVGVVGASGSGKSSLVAAGLIPRLRAGALPGSAAWVDITFKPGERGGDPFLALAYVLKEVLGTTGLREVDLARDLRATPDCFASCVEELLRGRPPSAELLLVIDQFEELFTLVSADDGSKFLELMATAVRTLKVRVIVTMRAEFLADAIGRPVLTDLLRGRGIFTVAAPGVLALTEMIQRPARAAELALGEDLCERILKDTGTGSGALALMAFALHELYERGKEVGRLTLQDYGSLGGVTGAIEAQAEKAIQPLVERDDRALQRLFLDLIEINDQGVATRRRAPLEQIRQDPSRAKLVDALVDARILVTDTVREKPTVEIAHEAVFSGWGRLSRWIDAHEGELRVCRSLARAARDWQEAGAPPFDHLPDRATLKQYRRVRPSCALGEDAAVVTRFMSAARRRQKLWGSFLALVVLLVSILGVHIWLQTREMNWNVLRIWTLARMGFYGGPEMVEVPGDRFLMGASDCPSDGPPTDNSGILDRGCPQHPVAVKPFQLGKYEVTFDEYSAFVLDMDGFELPHDQGWGSGARPVIDVSWDDARAYAEWLSTVTGQPFRLPTEAEWEYAARAGTTTSYWWGDEVRKGGKAWANCSGCGSEWGGKRTAPVGSFPANGLGLHDMHGNVWEWVEDDWHGSYEGAPDDGSAWVDHPRGSDRVTRGGSWFNDSSYCRSAHRSYDSPDARNDSVGFRLSRSVAPSP